VLTGAETTPDALAGRVRAFLASHDPAELGKQEFLNARFDAGLAWVHYPEGLGGLGISRTLQSVVDAGFAAAGAPANDPERNGIGLGMAAPTILAYGNDEQQKRWLRKLWTAEEVWCQLFSEPGAGSDLAALATRAVRDDQGWIVSGQKVWTSQAHQAKRGLLLTRTDPDVPKHQGLTYFAVDMTAPGVDVRPLRQLTGEAEFNEVFLTDVRIPDADRIGQVGEGWKVANATLGFERTASGQGTRRKGGTFEDLLRLASRLGKSGDPVVRQQLADVYVRTQLRSATTERVARAAAAGTPPGPAASIGKLVASANLMRIAEVASALLGARIAADTGEPDAFAWTEHVLGAPGYRLAGGTDEIQRNIIGERVLGLPREPRVDKRPTGG